MSFVGDMLAAIFERGRALVDFTTISQAAAPVEQIAILSQRLLSARGDARSFRSEVSAAIEEQMRVIARARRLRIMSRWR